MPWSTRQIADLAGTTVNTVRHYHQIGLLEEPERLSNGYKQYTVPHLVRLLRIRRLAELGIPLGRITDVEDDSGVEESLHSLDAELRSRIDQLEEARRQIAALLAQSAPVHTPPGFETVSGTMSEADQALVQIYSQLYSPEAQADVRSMIESSTEASARFDALPADADETAREALARDLLPDLLAQLEAHPWLKDPARHYAKDRATTQRAFAEALSEVYNAAQLDVIARTERLASERAPAEDPGDGGADGPTGGGADGSAGGSIERSEGRADRE